MYVVFLIIGLSVLSINCVDRSASRQAEFIRNAQKATETKTSAKLIGNPATSQAVRDTQTNRAHDYIARKAALETGVLVAQSVLNSKRAVTNPSQKDIVEFNKAQKDISDLQKEIHNLNRWYNSLPAL